MCGLGLEGKEGGAVHGNEDCASPPRVATATGEEYVVVGGAECRNAFSVL